MLPDPVQERWMKSVVFTSSFHCCIVFGVKFIVQEIAKLAKKSSRRKVRSIALIIIITLCMYAACLTLGGCGSTSGMVNKNMERVMFFFCLFYFCDCH